MPRYGHDEADDGHDGHDGQQMSPHLTPGQTPSKDVHGTSCFTSMHLEDILLAVALGHSLHRSESLLAALPREVMQHHLARHIRQLFLEDLSARGLLTPVHTPTLTPRRPPPLRGKWRETQGRTREVTRRPPTIRMTTAPFTSSSLGVDDRCAEQAEGTTHAAAIMEREEARADLWKFEETAVVRQPAPALPTSPLSASPGDADIDCN